MTQAQNTNLYNGEAKDARQKMDNKVTDSNIKSVLSYVCYTKEMCIRNLYFKDGQASILPYVSE
jgi:hypothetical protein